MKIFRFSALAHRIHLALEEHPDLAGQLVRVNRPPTRKKKADG
jgi:hypothetical protein